MAKKTQQVGIVAKNDEGKRYIKLGNNKNKDPKYNYTVELRVLNNDGDLIVKKVNPSLSMWNPKTKFDWLEKNLTISLEEKSNND